MDVICHEADLREGLGLPLLTDSHWQPFLEVMELLLRKRRLCGSNASTIHG